MPTLLARVGHLIFRPTGANQTARRGWLLGTRLTAHECWPAQRERPGPCAPIKITTDLLWLHRASRSFQHFQLDLVGLAFVSPFEVHQGAGWQRGHPADEVL